ncbi:MAG: DUF1080 domain-containing protein [Planctomycetes bacterium]|nr:DUF1080 domain-containing protein [Planctomycetota bacterium]
MPNLPPIPMPLTVTAFTKDAAGRWVYNIVGEAITGQIDVLVVGGGSFGAILAEHLFRLESPDAIPSQPPSPIADPATNALSGPPHPPHRIVVLEAGPHGLPEHIQNMPVGLNLGLGNFPDELDPNPSNTPWTGNVPFPGLAYVVGGRSLFWGGWSPELLDSELETWPRELVEDLKGRRFPEAKRQLGTDTTNDFIFGPLHCALRQRLFQGINRGAVPFVFHVFEEADLEAPLAVQSAAPRSGFLPVSKFSSVPLLASAARRAGAEVAFADDARKRLLIVPNCKVTKLNEQNCRVQSAEIEYAEIAPQIVNGAPQLVKTVKNDTLTLSNRGKVVIALGTIESTRMAKVSFDRSLMGRNLMAHLRSNLVVRLPRSTFQHLPSELEASALFLKGKSQHGHFHFQITAYGNPTPLNPDQEAELFKTVPSVEQLDYFREVDDRFLIMVIRGIGEMESDRSASGKSHVKIDAQGRAQVTLEPTDRDQRLWGDMDTAAEKVAQVFAAGGSIEYLWEHNWGSVWRRIPPPHAPKGSPSGGVRDGLGTTHHEAGTLWMGTDPNDSVTDAWGRFHHIANAYVAGPALFPTIGSPNPMLTGTALARRTAHKIARAPVLTPHDGPVEALAPAERRHWYHAGAGTFRDDGAGGIVAEGGMGLLWFSKWQLRNFKLSVEWRVAARSDNSGVFLRFPDPAGNPWEAVDRGYEVQIDDIGADDDPAEHGKPIYQTGAIYGIRSPSNMVSKDPASADPWNRFVIQVVGQTYDVWLNDEHIIQRFEGSRGEEGYIGLQNHGTPVTFRSVAIEALPF